MADSGVYLIIGKRHGVDGTANAYPLPPQFTCQECRELLSLRLVEKKIQMHDKCLINYKRRQAKQRLVAAAIKATGAELVPTT
jgi:hypothetical protein